MTVLLKSIVFFALIFVFWLWDDSKTHLSRGLSFLQNKDYIEAVNEFTMAIAIDPQFGEAYYYRAVTKDLMAKQGGFISFDLCSDLILAIENGYTKALPMLREKSDQVCHNLKRAVAEPDVVFCADFSSMVIKELPDKFEEMVFLTHLKLFNNKFETYPNLSSAKYLICLDLSSNQLTGLPESFADNLWLSQINFSRNKLTAIPATIEKLKFLNDLNLSENYLTTLPASFSALTNLETLDLSFNRFRTLPPVLQQMPALKTLILRGNPLDENEVNELRKKLKDRETKVYFN